MNASSTNAGGWNESKMRTETMATLLSQLPSDLRNVIKAVNKKATAGNQGTSLTASSDKLWLFAAAELWSKTAIENSASSDLKNNAAAYNKPSMTSVIVSPVVSVTVFSSPILNAFFAFPAAESSAIFDQLVDCNDGFCVTNVLPL